MEKTQQDNHPFQGIVISNILRTESPSGVHTVAGRRSCCFIIKMTGSTLYRWEGKQYTLSAGQILYVEKGCFYGFEELVPGYSYIINFDCPARLPQPLGLLPLPREFDPQPLAERIFRLWHRRELYSTLSALYKLLERTTPSAQREGRIRQQESLHLQPVMAYLEQHLTDPELRLEELPKLAGVSDTYLRRIFKKQHGISPAGYVLHERMQLAAQLLICGEYTHMAEVSQQVGYQDPLYFSRVFKKHMGLSPTEFAKVNKEYMF